MLRVGLDFDGVVAYNPFRILRAPIKYLKRKLFGVRKLTFFVPRSRWEKMVWTIMHESSIFPAPGSERLLEISKRRDVELHLITARFGFLKKNLYAWLERNKLREAFKTININEKQEQPHVFKERMVRKLKLDVYVEDNLDIVEYMGNQSKVRVFWIYNLLDAGRKFPRKYPYLGRVLEDILK